MAELPRYFNQLHLEKQARNKNIDFLRQLHAAELQEVCKWFDYLPFNGGVRRIENRDMTLDRFCEIFAKTKRKHIIGIGLQIGSPDEKRMTHFIRLIDSDEHVSELFSWVQYPYTPQNYQLTKGIFSRVFSFNLETIEIPECLRIYHQKNNRAPYFRR